MRFFSLTVTIIGFATLAMASVPNGGAGVNERGE
jgi:hypothetical protein